MFINTKEKITVFVDNFKIEYEWKIEKETEKAILVNETVVLMWDEGRPRISKTKEWMPKSAIKVLSDGWIAVADWIPETKGFHPVNIVPVPHELRPEEYKNLGTKDHPMPIEKNVEMYQKGFAKLEPIPFGVR